MNIYPDDAAHEITRALALQFQHHGSWMAGEHEYQLDKIDLSEGPGKIYIYLDTGGLTRWKFLIDVRYVGAEFIE